MHESDTDIRVIQDMCYRCYGAYLLDYDAERVLQAYIQGARRLTNPLMDSLLFFLNNPKERRETDR